MEDEGSVAPATAVEGPARRTPADDERRRARRGLGCLAGGLAGVVGSGVALLALLGMTVSSLTVEGCDLDVEIGPGDGTDSQRLDVDVAPTTDLRDGTIVFITSEAFDAGTDVGIAQCLAEAASERAGVEACDDDAGTWVGVEGDGVLRAAFAVDRVITVRGRAHDCAEAAERCILVAASSSDYDLSGGEPLTFADDLPPVIPTPSAGRARSVYLPGSLAPSGPLAAGTTATASAEGFFPDETVLVVLCTSDVLTSDPWRACQNLDGTATNPLELLVPTSSSGTVRADDAGRVEIDVVVPRALRPVGGLTDDESVLVECATDPGRCGVVVAATADVQRSAYLGLTVSR